jgi:hypothetical protein
VTRPIPSQDIREWPELARFRLAQEFRISPRHSGPCSRVRCFRRAPCRSRMGTLRKGPEEDRRVSPAADAVSPSDRERLDAPRW